MTTGNSDHLSMLVDLGLEIILWHEQEGVEIFCPSYREHRALATVAFADYPDRHAATKHAIELAAAELTKLRRNP